MKNIIKKTLVVVLGLSLSLNNIYFISADDEVCTIISEVSIDDTITDADIQREINSYIEENYEEGGEIIENVEDSVAYSDYIENGKEEAAELVKKHIEKDKFKEMTMVLKITENDDGCITDCNVMSEDEALEEIDSEEIDDTELNDGYGLKKCSYKAGSYYIRKSSDGYMRLTFSSYKKDAVGNKWTIGITYRWLKNPIMRFSDALTFYHDSNISVDTSSIDFSAYRSWTVKATGEKCWTKYRYKNGLKLGSNEYKATKDFSTDSISFSFGMGSTQGLIKYIKDETISGALTFTIIKSSTNTLSSNIGFSYIHTTLDFNTNLAKAISWTANGKVKVSGINKVTKYKYYDAYEF